MQHHRSHSASLSQRALQIAGYLLCLILLCTSIYLVDRHTLRSMNDLQWSWYGFSELLINYDQGFVRRGLIGELLRRWSHGNSALPAANILLFSNVCILTAALTLLALKRSTFRPWNLVFLLLMPGSLVDMAVTSDFFHRKETFFYTALALSALAVAAIQAIQSPAARKLLATLTTAAIFLFSIVLICVHEAFFFLAMPANIFLLLAVQRSLAHSPSPQPTHPARWQPWKIYLTLISILFLTMFYFHGNADSTDKMWLHLNAADRQSMCPRGDDCGAMQLLPQSALHLLKLPLHKMIAGSAWYWFVPLIGVMLYCLALVSLNIHQDTNNQNTTDQQPPLYPWLLCYLTLAAAIFPLVLIAEDWGRWIVALNLSFLILWLAIKPHNLAIVDRQRLPLRLLPAAAQAAFFHQARIFARFFLRFTHRYRVFVLAIMLLFAITFRMHELYVHESMEYLLILAFRVVTHFGNHALMYLFHTHSLGPNAVKPYAQTGH